MIDVAHPPKLEFDVGSENDVLKIMQLFAAGLISRRTAVERLGLVEDVVAELARIDADRG